ncbi:MAG: hypothetical protein JWL63_812 [Rhodocyclales bacterium]|nr:hypothetical protein [Rhodocyclales bacterium]
MKKPKKEDDLRAEYRREDFGVMTRGKYADKVAKSSNVVVIDPQLAKVFPNADAVNGALRGLVEIAKSSTRAASRTTKSSKKAAA